MYNLSTAKFRPAGNIIDIPAGKVVDENAATACSRYLVASCEKDMPFF